MTATITIKCDNCTTDLTETTGRPGYRLSLQSELIPNTSGLALMVKVHPPIKETHHFCGTGCLEIWLQQRNSKTVNQAPFV